MKESLGILVARKLKAMFLAAFIFSMAWACWEIKTDEEIVYHIGTHFYNMTLNYFFYMGFFVLIYGIWPSLVVEAFQWKWFHREDWLYVLLLGGCGSAIGLLFPFQAFVAAGILGAALYGVIDKWLLKRWLQKKRNKALFISPVLAYLLLGGFFMLASPPLPPVTAEDAVKFATYDNDTKTDDFPNEVGTWKGTVDGYDVVRKTTVEQLEKNLYLVIFTEKWQKGAQKGTWMTSYRVDRGSMTLHGQQGGLIPYDTIETAE